MRKVDPISKDEAWDNFVSAINNEKTLENYVRSLNEFMAFHNLRSYDKFIKVSVPQIQNFLKEWINHLKSKNLQGNTIMFKITKNFPKHDSTKNYSKIDQYCNIVWFKKFFQNSVFRQ